MKWQCALLQRWLPEYPDGDLPALGKHWLKSHLTRCSACQEELGQLREVVATIEATPVADPAQEFWQVFSREMHLKLVQAAQDGQAAPVSASPRRFRLPYLLGAPALVVLLLYVAVHFTGPGVTVPDQARVKQQAEEIEPSKAKMAAAPAKAPAPGNVVPTAPVLPAEQFATVALEEGGPPPVDEVDISGWDLDAELAGMTDQEKNAFLNKLHQKKKDGSCVEGFSFCSWG
jgi:anti-sigma factor RsiW